EVHDGRVEHVPDVPAAVGQPGAVDVPGSDGILIGLRADDGVVTHEVRVGRYVTALQRAPVRRRTHAIFFGQLCTLALVVVGKLLARVVADARHEQRVQQV